MSFDAVVQAIKDKPELASELQAASTPAARAAILDAHGIEKPHANSQFPEMADTAGGQGTTTDGTSGASATAAAA
jgi:hypothetical protein